MRRGVVVVMVDWAAGRGDGWQGGDGGGSGGTRNGDLLDAVLEHARHVERDDADDDRRHVADRAASGPDARRGVRPTYRPVAVGGDQHHQPNTAHVRDRRQQPDIAHVRPGKPRVGAVLRVDADIPVRQTNTGTGLQVRK